MHSYSSDSIDRKIAPWLMAAGAVGVAYMYSALARYFDWSLPWWVSPPGIMAAFGCIQVVYNRWLWRKRLAGLRMSQIPDISGTWFGEVSSSFDNGTSNQGMLVVHQLWSTIVLEFRTESSVSFSRMAAVNVRPGPSQGLLYEYTNDPMSGATASMHSHRGLATLRVSRDGATLEGEYFAGRDRLNHGRLTLHRISFEQLDFHEAQRRYESEGASHD